MVALLAKERLSIWNHLARLKRGGSGERIILAGEIDKAREKAHQGPLILAIIGRIDPDHPKITASDQWLAVGCALENLLLAAQSFGFAAAIRSGRFLETAPMREGFALGPNEHLVSLIALGTPAEWPPEKPKPSLDQVFSIWGA